MDIQDALAATSPAPATHTRRQEHPSGREYEWDGSAGWLRTEPLEDRPKTWDAFILDAGLDPAEVEVLEPVQVRGWDMPKSGYDEQGRRVTSLVRAHYYRLTLRRRALKVDLDDLVSAAKRRVKSTAAAKPATADVAFTVALGDLQLGKADGDGVEGTVARFFATTQASAERYRSLKRKYGAMPIRLFHLGDCIEGFVSQGGANAWRTTLTTTEQVRLYRRILLEQIKTFAALTPDLVVAGIPGNHDEAHRPLHTYGDSWAIDALSAVQDALDLAGGYEHVRLLAPARDELVMTLDVCGTVVGLAHGHQFGRGAEGWKTWWKGQQHGRQPVGDADLLFAGHLHHLRVQRDSRSFVQVPALESESTWFRHMAGEGGSPGVVTMLVGGGSWSALEVV
jgi:predicted phosphodiesterase